MSRLSYLGLFDWVGPGDFVMNVLLRPMIGVVTFGFLGRYVAGDARTADFVVGVSAVGLTWMTLSGAIQSIANERGAGTLGILFGTTRPRFPMYVSRVVLHIPAGLTTIASCMLVGSIVFGLDARDANWPAFVAASLIATLSLGAVGLLGGSIALVVRDTWSFFGTFAGLIFVLSGGIVPVTQLPGPMPKVVSIVPLRWGIEAMRDAFAGQSLFDVWYLIGYEALVGSCYLALGYALFRWFEGVAKQAGTLDLV